ncbi:hypothetical protein ABEB22_18410 (plasmid) [Thioclava sp. 'Guangxiensis']|uniref:hypothetical protein n=1 Tax=Thioclava sp. 'Guangxiensis' TaxID=3149044 RepID=UPI0032C3F973
MKIDKKIEIEVQMQDFDDDFSAIMVLSPLHNQAFSLAQRTLESAHMLHADSIFDGPDGRDNVLFSCFNPVRAATDKMLTGSEITSIVDSNFLSGIRRILDQPPNSLLNKENKEILAFVILSGLCEGAITPGMAYHEMQGNSSDKKHLLEAFNAYEFLWFETDLDLICETLIQNRMPDWGLSDRLTRKIPRSSLTKIRSISGGQRYYSELYATIVAATIELKSGSTISNNTKFKAFIEAIYRCGAFGMGSLRYFSLYFSDTPSKLGVQRKSMLKQVHSGSFEKIKRGILNAASDCYFLSEYGSAINSFHERRTPRVFVTSDTALKKIMESEFNDRNLWQSGVSATIDRFRGEQMDPQTASMIDDAIPIFDAGQVPKKRPAMRESAKHFLANQDQAIVDAWLKLAEVVGDASSPTSF